MTKTASGQKELIADAWLSGVLGQKVYKLDSSDVLDSTGLKTALSEKGIFVYTKVPAQEIEKLSHLEDLGFRLIDTNVTFEKPASQGHTLKGNCTVRFASPEDRAQTVALAESSFQYSRFHLDPEFPKTTADKVKAGWVDNYFSGKRGDLMVVALADNKVAGFLQLLKDKETLVIDLIAVSAAQRGKGLAGDMMGFAENNIDGIEKVRVGTQVANVPSVNLYEKKGFQFAGAQYVLHFHNKG